MNSGSAYRVLIYKNLVTSLDSVDSEKIDQIATENLEAAKEIAKNYREKSTIDGEYFFPSIHSAKDFALLALDFVKKLTEKSEINLNAHNFYAKPNWYNPSVGKR
ncbi:MAG: hypothetical protein CMF69_05440 [Magnetovibrio sp.]|nr:hypothetical protein [Magnetovibrio sp.]|tara:strand:+ start:144 stop:458 length:315 start_codon:yes stop_codon:yes gene_type:complete